MIAASPPPWEARLLSSSVWPTAFCAIARSAVSPAFLGTSAYCTVTVLLPMVTSALCGRTLAVSVSEMRAKSRGLLLRFMLIGVLARAAPGINSILMMTVEMVFLPKEDGIVSALSG